MNDIQGLNNFRISKWYRLNQFEDPLTHEVKMWAPFIFKLDEVSDLLSVGLTIISGYRTPKYNATLPDAVKNSAHLYGLAADVRSDSLSHSQIALAAQKVGIPRIKVYPPTNQRFRGWVHLGYNDYRI